MLSKLLVFFALLYLGVAQTSDMPGTTMMPAPTMLPDPTTMMPAAPTTMMPADPTTMMPADPTTMSTDPPTDSSTGFDSPLAMRFRQRNFYCLNSTDTGFPPETRNSDGSLNAIYWSVLFQYPVISYLDVRRKENLLALIVGMVRQGAESTSRASSLNESELCIGPVDHYRVSYYDESVLLRIYFRDTASPPISISEFNTYFRTGFMRVAGSSSDNRVQTFLDRNALAIDSIMPAGGFINENSHPGAQGLTPENDPTLRAVLISSFVGNVTLETATTDRNVQEFANNPRPINYGLEAGDIVFAVFGSIFLGIVGFLTVLGFCIHPFFLA